MSAASATGPRWRPAEGLVSVHFVNASGSVLVAPFGGVERRFSTAPYCVGVPRPGAGSAGARLRHLDRGRGQGAGRQPGRQEAAGGRADRRRTASRAPIRTCSTATTRRPARATTARAPAPSARSATTRARASPSCARCWAARSPAPARPIPSAAASPTACCRSTSIPRCSIRRASSRRTSRKYVAFVKSSRPATPGGEILVPGEPEARMRAEAPGRRRAAARRHLGRHRRDGPLGRPRRAPHPAGRLAVVSSPGPRHSVALMISRAPHRRIHIRLTWRGPSEDHE